MYHDRGTSERSNCDRTPSTTSPKAVATYLDFLPLPWLLQSRVLDLETHIPISSELLGSQKQFVLYLMNLMHNLMCISLVKSSLSHWQSMLDWLGPWQTRHFINESHRSDPPTHRDHDVGRQPWISIGAKSFSSQFLVFVLFFERINWRCFLFRSYGIVTGPFVLETVPFLRSTEPNPNSICFGLYLSWFLRDVGTHRCQGTRNFIYTHDRFISSTVVAPYKSIEGTQDSRIGVS